MVTHRNQSFTVQNFLNLFLKFYMNTSYYCYYKIVADELFVDQLIGKFTVVELLQHYFHYLLLSVIHCQIFCHSVFIKRKCSVKQSTEFSAAVG